MRRRAREELGTPHWAVFIGTAKVITRRSFLKLVVGTAACAATPAVLFADAATTDDKLNQICSRVGQFVRDRNIKPCEVIAINEVGRLVIGARTDMKTDRVFHVADREGKYTRLGYRVEDRYLERTEELSVFVHTENGCHRFPLAFTRTRGEP